ncbi:MAG: hypothetical protein IAE78_27910 [Myxococcus sp.]|nr:hypothetical protein [Myxococcus sp.]
MANFKADPLYPRIVRAVDGLLRRGNVVAPIEVLVEMELVRREQLEDWRRGRVAFLEGVINCNLSRLGRLLRILRFHAHEVNLKPGWTAYMRWGRAKQRLRFTKTGEPKLEEIYATHLVWPGKMPFTSAPRPRPGKFHQGFRGDVGRPVRPGARMTFEVARRVPMSCRSRSAWAA